MKFMLTILMGLSFPFFFLVSGYPFFESFVLSGRNSPAIMNHADHSFRIAGQYRKQWAAVQAPYDSYGLQISHRSDRFIWLADLLQQQAGDQGIRKLNLGLGATYRHYLNRSSDFLTIGAKLGLAQKRIQAQDWIFNSQIDPSGQLIPGANNGETINQTNASGMDLSIGLGWQGQIRENISAQINIGLFHLNQPNMSFMNDQQVRLPIRTSVQANLNIKVDALLEINPYLQYDQQGQAKSVSLGSMGKYQFKDQQYVHYGLAYRWNDALILHGGIEIKQHIIYLAYDINTSSLKQASSSNGAFEMGLVFNLPEGKKRNVTVRDSDKDGIVDISDHCPNIPGAMEFDGCPNPNETDSDQDGLADAFDECPNTAGLMALRGCPEYRKTDSDEDGIPDYLDLCPYQAGNKAYQGCVDSDEDGIWDLQDACPNVFGSIQNNGCPEKLLDSDQDGIPNDLDDCPYLKGLARYDGCPDSDQDGIPDLQDDCPYLAGSTRNLGCPDKYQSKNSLKGAEKTLTIEFDTDQSYIKPAYVQPLSEIVNLLFNNPNLMVILSGHTDNEGSDYYNFKLSDRRAQEVRMFLLNKGIEGHRIQCFFYGERVPKKANDSSNAKARNRRTEVYIKAD